VELPKVPSDEAVEDLVLGRDEDIHGEEDEGEKRDPDEDKEYPVIFRPDRLPLQRQEKGSWNSSNGRDNKKGKNMHGAQTEEVTKIILRQPGMKKKSRRKRLMDLKILKHSEFQKM
jgi:hypothetical protein